MAGCGWRGMMATGATPRGPGLAWPGPHNSFRDCIHERFSHSLPIRAFGLPAGTLELLAGHLLGDLHGAGL